MKSFLKENIIIALSTVKSQLLRTILTVLIIAVGIAALVGILTAIDGIKNSINNNFSSVGANTFTIRNRGVNIHIGRRGKRMPRYRIISYEEAFRFRNIFNDKYITSISALATFSATVKYFSNKTNPNVSVFGSDQNYLITSGYEIEKGRNFSEQEILNGSNSVLIGKNLISNLFSNGQNPLDKIISIGNGKYKIIGVLKEKGSSMGFGGDKNVIIPMNNMRQNFSKPDISYVINILSPSPGELNNVIGEATGLFRIIRKLNLSEESNFEVIKSDNLANMLIENIQYVTLAATLIGFITLLGAAIGLMNIMLVSVTERTREIGIRKAIGANQITIRNQFLIEALVICQLGGLLGIILGILIGNTITLFLGGDFIIPWLWIFMGISLCFFVGIISGIYPANRAAKLDPIEALRTE